MDGFHLAQEIRHGGDSLQRPGNAPELAGVQSVEFVALSGGEAAAVRERPAGRPCDRLHEAVDIQLVEGIQHTGGEDVIKRGGAPGGQVVPDPRKAVHAQPVTEVGSLQA